MTKFSSQNNVTHVSQSSSTSQTARPHDIWGNPVSLVTLGIAHIEIHLGQMLANNSVEIQTYIICTPTLLSQNVSTFKHRFYGTHRDYLQILIYFKFTYNYMQ